MIRAKRVRPQRPSRFKSKSRIHARETKLQGDGMVMRESVEVMSINKPFIVDDSKIDAFWEAVRKQKGAKNKLLKMSKENRKNRLSNE